jgi:GNAT superfamily N-acetyltransferase
MEGAIERIEDAFADYLEERQTALKDADAVVQDIPGAVLYAARRRPAVDWMNTALVRVRPTDDLVDAVTAFYRDHRIAPRMETLTGEPKGFVPAGELFVLVGMAGEHVEAVDGVKVRRVDRSSFAKFADTYVKAFARKDILPSDVAAWQGLENWRFYLAEVDGKPAGAALLTLHGDVGYLASAATLPAMRRRGVHAALLRARMMDAADAGCSLLFARATPGSPGASNLTRARMMLSHSKHLWVLKR